MNGKTDRYQWIINSRVHFEYFCFIVLTCNVSHSSGRVAAALSCPHVRFLLVCACPSAVVHPQGSVCEDWTTVYCCYPLAVCQMIREMKRRMKTQTYQVSTALECAWRNSSRQTRPVLPPRNGDGRGPTETCCMNSTKDQYHMVSNVLVNSESSLSYNFQKKPSKEEHLFNLLTFLHLSIK